MSTKSPKTNSTKVNATVDINSLFNELNTATCKKSLVDTMTKFGLQCVTAPTTTPNTNDLYLQFNANKCGDVSRVQLTSKSIKIWCTSTVKSLFDGVTGFAFDDVNDGSSRKFRATVKKTVDNFTTIFNKLYDNGIIVPIKTE